MISVFVYGTLLVGESNHQVAAPFVLSVQPGAVRGRLYDVGLYPALVLFEDGQNDAQDHFVVGEWLEVTEEGLKAMDMLEDYYGPGAASNEYERVWVRDMNTSREGWVYIWEETSGLKEIESGSWKEHRAR
ncbi:gamma-glutamylcyclotransferase family protein [Paenibacillus sedimenti]|uniref:Gamma-glutamylcyclotransferase n=1 Tax=Paenibacillus sedimenti TaxID=2770274 RepID=A0A926KQ29_9BACL|nr:gamma-glutamylcyclotransferase family protein [Paenibacillus sedimenti]MBD0380030.1 gamma-glutamylcyclotransferase [Paenibacillus sedimenti]